MPQTDERRSIDYVKTRLVVDHVMASSAIPIVFPPVEVYQPPRAGWYVDGGLRLNTPLKPAVDLRAAQLLIIATDPAEAVTDQRAPGAAPPPSAGGGAGRGGQPPARAADRPDGRGRAHARRQEPGCHRRSQSGPRRHPLALAGPRPGSSGPLADLAGQVLQGRAPGQGRGSVVGRLRRSAGAWVARDPGRLEVVTHLLFDPDFIEGAIELGRRDAQRSLDSFGSPRWQLTGQVPAAAPAPVGACIS